MKTDTKKLQDALDIMVPNPRCELEFNNDYELVISVMLSAQCTDKRVNQVTKNLYSKYSLEEISNLDTKVLEKELHSLGSYTKKALYTQKIAQRLLKDFNGHVPNNREYLESLPGVGHKSANVILAELYNVPTMAVDTHVTRVANRLGLVRKTSDVKKIENKLMKLFPKEEYNKVNHQLLLLGRYTCTAKNPKCVSCIINCPNKNNTDK